MMPKKGVHLVGFPRFRHANEQRAQFVFDGTPTSEAHLTQMDEKKASWITQNREYKKLMMVQEEGFMAQRRHELQDESTDRLVQIIGERNHALRAKQHHGNRCSKSLANIRNLKLNGKIVEKQAANESNVVENAQNAWRDRVARTPPTKSLAKCSGPVGSQLNKPPTVRALLTDPHEREYSRFLKEGPRRGDGCFTETPAATQARILRRTFDRTQRHMGIKKMWSNDPY